MRNIEETRTEMNVGEEQPLLNVREVLAKYIYHWPVFVLSILVCLLGALVYLRYVQPVYSVNSTLLIKDQGKGGGAGSSDLLNELDLFGSSKVIENEIEILKSKTLMRKVVDRLDLSATLRADGRLKNSELYTSKPVRIELLELAATSYGRSFSLSLIDENTYQLKDQISGEIRKGTLNELQKDDLGIYRIHKDIGFKNLTNTLITLSFSNPTVLADQLLNQLNVTLASKQSSVLNLSVQTTVPEKGQDVLNTLIQVYNEAALLDKNKTTQSTIDFIDGRLKLITGELTDVEKDVETFKSSRGLTDLTSEANLYLENVKINDTKLNEINLQISVVRDIERYINSKSANEKLPSTLGISDPVLLGQITQLSDLQLQLDRLLTTTTEKNPLLDPIKKQMETTRAAIKTSIENLSTSLNVSKANLEKNNLQFQGSIKKVPGQERQLIGIKRQQAIKESLYLYLLQKKEEAALSYASAVADSRTVDPAYYSTTPIRPKNQLIYLVGFVFGMLLPVGYLFVKEILNDKVESQLDIEKLTTAPLLGQVSFSEESTPIVVKGSSRKAIAEQFRAIRTNMQFLHSSTILGRGNVTLFTSSMSGEGKSFVACNVAAALALNGKRVILIELDLRKPKISKYLNLDNKVGMSNYLIGKASTSDIIQPSNVDPNLFVIGSGPIPPNPSELLTGVKIDELISDLVENFDEVIIDTPPVGLVTDAQILARITDATIFLIRQDVTFKEQVKRFQDIYNSKKFPKVHIILNGVKAGTAYGYGYGYGYGYYSDDDQTTKLDYKSLIRNIQKRF